MKQQYLQALFSFRAEHKNLTNLDVGLFQMEPTEEGRKTLQSYGLHFKPQESGFVIAAPCFLADDHGLLELEHQFVGKTKLAFVVFTNDKYFFDHSGLPYDPPGEYVYYFNNLNADERRTRILLEEFSVKDSERVKLHTKQFSGEAAKNAEDEFIVPRVYDCQGKIISETQYEFTVNEYQNTYFLDLSRLPDGLYTVEYDEQILTCYCTKASFIRRIPLLILEIFIDPAVPEEYQIVKVENGIQYIDHKDFCLHFGLNLYYWQYKIIPINVPPCTWIKVQADQSPYTFTPDKIRLHQQLDYVLFTSQQKIDIPNEDEFMVNLYRVGWQAECRLTTDAYKFCLQDYGIEIDNDLRCREVVDDKCIYPCPAYCIEDELIGALPKPGGEETRYYTEDGKPFAQLTLYLVYKNGEYLITDTYDPPSDPGHFTHCVIEEQEDVTIQFRNKVTMSYVILHYKITGKIGQQDMYMNKIGNIYSMDKIVKRFFPYLKIVKGDQIVYWFTYELITKQVYTSEKFTHIFQCGMN